MGTPPSPNPPTFCVLQTLNSSLTCDMLASTETLNFVQVYMHSMS